MRRFQARQQRIPLLLLSATAIAVLVGVAYVGHVFGRAEDWTMDKRFALRGAQTPEHVALVAIDDQSLKELGQWPFPRRYHARLIANISRAKPSAIAVDIQFTESTDTADDGALMGAVGAADAHASHRGSGRVVLETTEVDQAGGTNVLGGRAESLGARVGFALMRVDAGGVLRRMDWGSRASIDGQPSTPLESLALATAEVATGRAIPRSRVKAATTIAYVGPPGTFPVYSYVDVMRGRVPPHAFEGKVVLVGATARSLGDVHTTPYGAGRPMAGAEVQANAIETALHDFPLRPSRTRALLLIVLFSFLVPIASLFLRWRWCVLVAGLAAVLYLVAAQVSFDHGILLPAVWPLLALALGTFAASVLRAPRSAPAAAASAAAT